MVDFDFLRNFCNSFVEPCPSAATRAAMPREQQCHLLTITATRNHVLGGASSIRCQIIHIVEIFESAHRPAMALLQKSSCTSFAKIRLTWKCIQDQKMSGKSGRLCVRPASFLLIERCLGKNPPDMEVHTKFNKSWVSLVGSASVQTIFQKGLLRKVRLTLKCIHN